MADDISAQIRIRQLEQNPPLSKKIKQQLVEIAKKLHGTSEYITDQYSKAVKKGRLACALFVTEVLKRAGILTDNILSVDGTVETLKNLGWKTHSKQSSPEAGWIIVWAKGANGAHKHIGIVLDKTDPRNVPLAMNNNSATGTAVEKPIDYKPVEKYLSPPTSLA